MTGCKKINDQSGSVAEIIRKCDIFIGCQDGFVLNLTDLGAEHSFFQTVTEIQCPLILLENADSKINFKKLANWKWIGASHFSGFIHSVTFDVLEILDGNTLQLGPSTSLTTVSFGNRDDSKTLNKLSLCNVPNFEMEHLGNVKLGSTDKNCTIIEDPVKVEEKPEPTPFPWLLVVSIIAGSLSGIISALLLGYFCRRRIIAGIRIFIEWIATRNQVHDETSAAAQNLPRRVRGGIFSPRTSPKEEVRVDIHSIDGWDNIAAGGFGVVCKGTHSQFGPAAAKVFTGSIMKKSDMEMRRRELKYGIRLGEHPFMTRTIAGIFYPNQGILAGVLMEFLDGGNIWDYIFENREIEEPILNKWALDAAKGLGYMHGLRLMHRDIKPLNLLLTANRRRVKICDLGLTTRIGRWRKHQIGIGNLAFTAPEIFLTSKYGRRSDIYSLGMTFYYIYYGREPFADGVLPHGNFSSETAKILMEDGYRPQLEGKKIDQLIKRCWLAKPKKRPCIGEILEILDGEEGRRQFLRISE